jgi:hypothetical protein
MSSTSPREVRLTCARPSTRLTKSQIILRHLFGSSEQHVATTGKLFSSLRGQSCDRVGGKNIITAELYLLLPLSKSEWLVFLLFEICFVCLIFCGVIELFSLRLGLTFVGDINGLVRHCTSNSSEFERSLLE